MVLPIAEVVDHDRAMQDQNETVFMDTVHNGTNTVVNQLDALAMQRQAAFFSDRA